MMERRRESRPETGFPVRVWGVDRDGRYFSQQVQARNVSISGALFSELDQEPRAGDLIGVEYSGKKARFRVVWVLHSGNRQKVQVAVHRVHDDECPWLALLPARQPVDNPPIHPSDGHVRNSELAEGLVYNPTPTSATTGASDGANVPSLLPKNTVVIGSV